MAVPKRRQSKARRNSRRANHDRIGMPTFGGCRNCGAQVRPHTVCGDCGHYRGREVIEIAKAEEEELDEAI
jgi:large subunit ribosomal protein L32